MTRGVDWTASMSDTLDVTTTKYRLHGTTDDTDTCEQCGKVDLRSVVMLAVLDDGEETGELIYVGSTCAARLLARRGTRTTAARVRDGATAAARILTAAREFADEFDGFTLNRYIAANATGLLNANDGDTTRALADAKVRYAELQEEIKTIRSGTVAGTRFAAKLPVL